MFKTEIKDLNMYKVNERNGIYGGSAGDKEGVTISGEYWIIKYPKSTKGLKGNLESYTTSPLSEYIGSHIYQLLDIDVHDTILGVRNNKLVVACKDFCKKEGSLREFRTLKNIYNKELSQKLEQMIDSTSSSNYIDIEDVLVHLQYNPILSTIPGIQNRFWEQLLVDLFINNNDRNNGNWGVLYENGKYSLAPVFDNGAAFANKTPEDKLLLMSVDTNLMKQSVNSNVSIYRINGHRIHGKDLVSIDNRNFYNTVLELVPKIENRISDFVKFIESIPEEFEGIPVCSKARAKVYAESLKLKLDQFFRPAYAKARSLNYTLHDLF